MNRRPIKTRNNPLIQSLAKNLNTKGISPNTISQSSLLFAFLACLSFWSSQWGAGFLLLAAFFVQMRLLANLLDGLVAVEGGQATQDGAFWNEAPDRPADVLILLGLGIAAGLPMWGLVAGICALGTAYLRALGKTFTQEEDFSGPLAKPQRMFLATAAALVGFFEILLLNSTHSLSVFLFVIIVGTGFTIYKRTVALLEKLNN